MGGWLMNNANIACATCIHFDQEASSGDLLVRDRKLTTEVCAAFPNGIPKEIAFGDNRHRDPFPGDQGIRWVPDKGFEYFDTPERIEIDDPQWGVATAPEESNLLGQNKPT
jgi:hypothetical protein